ncbi:MAG: hypothetical protein ACRBF0_11435 [Calditrichia bacterium]
MFWSIVFLLLLFLTFLVAKALLADSINAKKRIKTLDNFQPIFADFINKLSDESILIIEHRKTKHFVQFMHFRIGRTEQYLHTSYPKTTWSEPFYSMIEETLKNKFEDVQIHKADGNEISQFVDANFIADVDKAVELTKELFSIMGISSNDTFNMIIKGELSSAYIAEVFKNYEEARSLMQKKN